MFCFDQFPCSIHLCRNDLVFAIKTGPFCSIAIVIPVLASSLLLSSFLSRSSVEFQFLTEVFFLPVFVGLYLLKKVLLALCLASVCRKSFLVSSSSSSVSPENQRRFQKKFYCFGKKFFSFADSR